MTPRLVAFVVAHIASIATLEPHVAAEIGDTARFWILAGQLPLITAAVLVHAQLKQQEKSVGLAELAVGLGLGYLTVLLLSSFEVLVGPANPLAAPAAASDAVKAGWFVGFAAIMTMGNTLFIARPLLGITDVIVGFALRMPPKAAQGLFAVVGAGLGFGLAGFASTDVAHDMADKLNEVSAANPVALLIAGLAIPLLLNVIKTLVTRKKKDSS